MTSLAHRTTEVSIGDDRGIAVRTEDGLALTWVDLYREYAPSLLSYARSRGVRNADDLVQDVLVSAVEQLPHFEGDRKGLRSLLFTIMFRRIADERRRFYRNREVLVADHDPLPDGAQDLEDLVTSMGTAQDAIKAFEILSDRERQVLRMRILDEASPAEVARALGLTNGNVRVIQARALVKLRARLLGEEEHIRGRRSRGLIAVCIGWWRSRSLGDSRLRHSVADLRLDGDRTDEAVALSKSPDVIDPAVATASSGLFAGAAQLGLAASLAAATTFGALAIGDVESNPPPSLGAAVTRAHESASGLKVPEPRTRDTIETVSLTEPTESVDSDRSQGDPPPLTSPKLRAPPRPSLPESPEVPSPAQSPMSEVGASTHVAAGGHEIDEGLAVIGPGVEQLVTDVVAPLLPGLVGPVVNEVVEPVVEHSVEPIVGAVVEPLEKLVAEVPSLLTRMGPG